MALTAVALRLHVARGLKHGMLTSLAPEGMTPHESGSATGASASTRAKVGMALFTIVCLVVSVGLTHLLAG